MPKRNGKERFSVTRSHSYGKHPWQPYETVQVQRNTIDRWVREWRNKAKREAFTFVRDNRSDNGTGSVELHYYYMGLPNARKIDISSI